MINYIISGFIALALSVGGWFTLNQVQAPTVQTPTLGAFGDPFLSLQVGSNPSSGYYLKTDGTNSTWAAVAGGGGSGGGTWATTTSNVSGQLINYPINDTDIPCIGNSATTTCEFWFDPNMSKAFIKNASSTSLTVPNAYITNLRNLTSNGFVKTGSGDGTLSVDTNTYIVTGGNAGTATALAANGANCSAGNYPLGVDASGAVENCTTDGTASSTLLADTNTWSALNTFTTARFNSIGVGKAASASIRNETILDGTYTQGQRFESDLVTRLAFSGYVTGDSQVRFTIRPDGFIGWGSGSATTDTNLYRSAANFLSTDDTFTSAYSSTTAASALNSLVVGRTASTTILGETTSTSTFAGGIEGTYLNVTGTSATSTFARGISLSGGCFAINGSCISGGGGSGTPGGSDTQLQFNDSSSFGGAVGLVWKKLTGILGVGTTTPVGAALVVSTSTTQNVLLTNSNTSSGMSFRLLNDATLAISTTTGASNHASTTAPVALFDGRAGVKSSFTMATSSTASASSTIFMGKLQFDGYNSAGTRYCTYLVGTTWTFTAGACNQ